MKSHKIHSNPIYVEYTRRCGRVLDSYVSITPAQLTPSISTHRCRSALPHFVRNTVRSHAFHCVRPHFACVQARNLRWKIAHHWCCQCEHIDDHKLLTARAAVMIVVIIIKTISMLVAAIARSLLFFPKIPRAIVRARSRVRVRERACAVENSLRSARPLVAGWLRLGGMRARSRSLVKCLSADRVCTRASVLSARGFTHHTTHIHTLTYAVSGGEALIDFPIWPFVLSLSVCVSRYAAIVTAICARVVNELVRVCVCV